MHYFLSPGSQGGVSFCYLSLLQKWFSFLPNTCLLKDGVIRQRSSLILLYCKLAHVYIPVLGATFLVLFFPYSSFIYYRAFMFVFFNSIRLFVCYTIGGQICLICQYYKKKAGFIFPKIILIRTLYMIYFLITRPVNIYMRVENKVLSVKSKVCLTTDGGTTQINILLAWISCRYLPGMQ